MQFAVVGDCRCLPVYALNVDDVDGEMLSLFALPLLSTCSFTVADAAVGVVGDGFCIGTRMPR